VDAKRNVAMDVLSRDWTPVKTNARLWPQTERMKIALALSESGAPGERAAYLREAIAATRGLMPYLDNPLPALWRDKLAADGSFLDEPAPATSLYHIAVAVFELIRVAEGFARARQAEA
jgi:mannose-6-phosphate isomerase